MKLKLNMFLTTLLRIKNFDISNYSANLKCYDDSNALVVDKMKGKIDRNAIKDFVGLKLKIL